MYDHWMLGMWLAYKMLQVLLTMVRKAVEDPFMVGETKDS